MKERLVLLASLYLTVAVALLHTSLAQTTLQVTYNFNGMPELVSLECLASSDGVIEGGATYTFMYPDGVEEKSVTVAEGVDSYKFTNHPTNESLITCTLDTVKSEPVRVVGTSSSFINHHHRR